MEPRDGGFVTCSVVFDYNCRKKCAGLMASEMRRLREFEEENTKLKRLIADLSPDRVRAAGRYPPQDMKLLGSGRWSIVFRATRLAPAGRTNYADREIDLPLPDN